VRVKGAEKSFIPSPLPRPDVVEQSWILLDVGLYLDLDLDLGLGLAGS